MKNPIEHFKELNFLEALTGRDLQGNPTNKEVKWLERGEEIQKMNEEYFTQKAELAECRD